MVTIGSNLKRIRENMGITQRELAGYCKLTASWISHYECGRREPNIWHAKSIAEAIGIDIEDLLEDAKPTRRKGGK